MNLQLNDKNYLLVPLKRSTEGLDYTFDSQSVLQMIGVSEQKEFATGDLVFSE
jgi:hypothetical protein